MIEARCLFAREDQYDVKYVSIVSILTSAAGGGKWNVDVNSKPSCTSAWLARNAVVRVRHGPLQRRRTPVDLSGHCLT